MAQAFCRFVLTTPRLARWIGMVFHRNIHVGICCPADLRQTPLEIRFQPLRDCRLVVTHSELSGISPLFSIERECSAIDRHSIATVDACISYLQTSAYVVRSYRVKGSDLGISSSCQCVLVVFSGLYYIPSLRILRSLDIVILNFIPLFLSIPLITMWYMA